MNIYFCEPPVRMHTRCVRSNHSKGSITYCSALPCISQALPRAHQLSPPFAWLLHPSRTTKNSHHGHQSPSPRPETRRVQRPWSWCATHSGQSSSPSRFQGARVGARHPQGTLFKAHRRSEPSSRMIHEVVVPVSRSNQSPSGAHVTTSTSCMPGTRGTRQQP